MIATAAVLVFARNLRVARLAAVAAVAFTAINLATLANGNVHATASVNGEQLDSLLRPAVSPAWGSYAELLVAILVAIGVFTQRAVVNEVEEPPPLSDKPG